MAHGDAREGKWRGIWWMELVASTLHTTSQHGVSSITTADAHTSAASSRLNWRPRRFKWTRPFRRKTKSCSCACAITFQRQSTSPTKVTTDENVALRRISAWTSVAPVTELRAENSEQLSSVSAWSRMFCSENIPDGVCGPFSGLPVKIRPLHEADCSLARRSTVQLNTGLHCQTLHP